MRQPLPKLRFTRPAFWAALTFLLGLPFGAAAEPLLKDIPNEVLLAAMLGLTILVLLIVFLIIGYMFYQNLNFILHSKPKTTDATR